MTDVVNVRDEPAEIMVGRPTKWGNPFVIGKHGTREQVIAKHAQWIWTQPELVAARHELAGATLGCYCKPLPCHGDTLAKLAGMRSCAIVCGGRDYVDRSMVFGTLASLVPRLKIDCVVTGGARGADTIAHEWALKAELLAPIEPAKWALQGKAAGGIRNQLMLDIIKKRVAPNSTVHADEAGHWDQLHGHFDTKRINHTVAYSLNGACTNQAESFLARLRRMVDGQHHHVSPRYLSQYANHAAWMEDHRRLDNGALAHRALGLALGHPVSRNWKGYWQRRRTLAPYNSG